jgi:hypothetical protein
MEKGGREGGREKGPGREGRERTGGYSPLKFLTLSTPLFPPAALFKFLPRCNTNGYGPTSDTEIPLTLTPPFIGVAQTADEEENLVSSPPTHRHNHDFSMYGIALYTLFLKLQPPFFFYFPEVPSHCRTLLFLIFTLRLPSISGSFRLG